MSDAVTRGRRSSVERDVPVPAEPATPAEAARLAAEAIHDLIWVWGDGSKCICPEAVAHEDAMRQAYASADVALAAAAPAIRADERQRLASLPDDPATWITVEADPDAPGRNRGTFDITGYAAVKAARIAELEQLARDMLAVHAAIRATGEEHEAFADDSQIGQWEATLKGQK